MTRSLLRTIDCAYTRPRFAAAFLRVEGDEVAFLETNTSHATPLLLDALRAEGLSPEQVRWIIVTHVHLDHAGGAASLAAACPAATVLAHPRAARHLRDPAKLVAGATHVYGPERFAALYGRVDPIPADRVRELGDGEAVPFGKSELRFWHTRGHAKHHFIAHDPALSAVFTGDTFGLLYPDLQRAGVFAFPSTSPTDFEPDEAHRSIDRVLSLGARAAYLTHFGEATQLDEIAGQLRSWIDLSASLVERARSGELDHPQTLALLRGAMAERASARGLDLSADDRDMLALDLDLNAQGLLAAAGR